MHSAIPPRLHVLLARDTDMAVVIRRGPSRHTAVCGWQRGTDAFRVGQWLYGRIYERRCDLSPDGKHLIYFAMNGRWSSAAKGSWTAVSRAPYLKAVCLYAKGDCWHGGGLFSSATAYWLNDGYGHQLLRDDSGLRRVTDHPWHEHYGGECPGVYYIRLQRDGWRMQYTAPDGQGGQVSLFEKRIGDHWCLRKFAHVGIHRLPGRGCYYDTHALYNARTGELLPHDDWEWADLDGARLVWAAGGKLYAGQVRPAGLDGARLLHDFGAMRFARLAAPY